MNSGNKGARRAPDKRATTAYRIRIGRNDITILRLVYEYRFLTQRQLERLLGLKKSTVQRLLRRLYDHAYLDRKFLPVSTFGSSPAHYFLDKRGAELLRRSGVEVTKKIPTADTTTQFLEHSVAISELRIAVSLACQARDWTIPIWLTETELKTKGNYDYVHVPASRKPIALMPDGFFSIAAPDRGTTHFFLELDRGTMELPRFRKKVEAYVSYYKSGKFAQRYKAQGFRVLTVVDGVGEGRVENLVKDTATVAGIGRRFWFTHLSEINSDTVLSVAIWRIAGSVAQEALV